MVIFNKILNKETKGEKDLKNRFNLLFKEYKLNEETLIFYENILKDSLLNFNPNKSELNDFKINNKNFIKIENLQSIELNSQDLINRQNEIKSSLQELEIELQFIKLKKFELFYSKIKNLYLYFYINLISLFITLSISFFAPKEKDFFDFLTIYLILYFGLLFIVFREKRYKEEIEKKFSLRKMQNAEFNLFRKKENLKTFKNI